MDWLSALKQQIKDIPECINLMLMFPLSELSLTDILYQCIMYIAGKQGDTKLFLILDQFEDYFWMQQERDRDKLFINELLKAVNNDSLNINYMVIAREKWINELNSFKDRLPCKYYLRLYRDNNNVNRVELIDPKSRQTHLPKFSVNIQPCLAETIWNDIKEAPYLQLVMSWLWEETQKAKTLPQMLQVKTYFDLGGAKVIVREHLYKQLERLNDDDRKIAIRLLYYLVTPSGTQLALTVDDLCRFVNDNRFSDEPELKPEQVHSLLEHFSQGRSRVLCPVASNCYQIYFSMLADVIFSWLQGLRKIKHLEQEAQQSMQRFEMFQLDALLKAIEIGHALREEIGRHPKLEEEDSVLTVILALQTIIDSIRERNQFRAPKGPIYSTNFSFDGQQLAIGASDGSVLLYDLQKKQLNKLCDLSNPVYYVTFNLDGHKLAISVGDGTILLWDLQSRQTLKFTVAGSPFYCISFSLDGQKMAAASGHGLVCLWDLESKEQIQCRQNFPIFFISISPDGQRLATASRGGSVQLWELQQQEKKLIEFAHKGLSQEKEVFYITFSPDGQQLAIAAKEAVVRILDLQHEGKKPDEYFDPREEEPFIHIGFIDHGQRLAAVTLNGTVCL